MTISDAIKSSVAPLLGKPLSPATLAELEQTVTQVIQKEQPGVDPDSFYVKTLVKQGSVFFTIKTMANNLQQQIDALQSDVTALQNSVDGLTIGEEVQAWANILDAIAALTPQASQNLGFDASSQLTQRPIQPRIVGEVVLLPYDPLLAGWTVSGAVYTDPSNWKWYAPNGAGINNSNALYENLFLALWGTDAYTISGGKGASAAADWAASKTLVIPDFSGRLIGSRGTSTGGSSPRLIGGSWGAETVTLAIANLPAHRHNVSVSNITASGIAGLSSSGLGVINNGNPSATSTILNVAGNRTANNDGLGAIADTGSGSPFNISQPSKAYLELWFMNAQ